MAKSLIVLITFISCMGALGQAPPLSAEEVERRQERLQTFLQPVQLRGWEIADDAIDGWKEWELVDNFSFGINRGSISMIADLESLHPYFRDKVLELIGICKSKGIEIAIVETYRTPAKQSEYRSMGRRYTRTTAGRSKHQYGLAIDIVPVVNSVPQWRNYKLWKKIGPIGERLGLRWGGRWSRLYDPGHFEWSGGMVSNHLAQGNFPAVPNPKDYPCLEEDLSALQRHWKAWEIEQSAIARTPPKNRVPSTLASSRLALRADQE